MKSITEGKVVKLVRHRGFGFLSCDDVDEDVFFHHSGLEDVYFEDLSVGDKLEFNINSTEKGPEAKNIQGIEIKKSGQEEPSSTQEISDEALGW